MELRECQIDAIECVEEQRENCEFETNLCLCTGAGKSIIIRDVTKQNERRIIVFPWLELLKQYYQQHYANYELCECVRYFATEGTLSDVEKLSGDMDELDEADYVIFTTYTSAPEIYSAIYEDREIDLICHDEAHRTERPDYVAAFEEVSQYVGHVVNLSATLPTSKEPNYKYSLLRGIHDGIVRDFHMELFMCTEREKGGTELIVTMIEKLLTLHGQVKLLVYMAEANTDGEESSSVKTFMDAHAETLRDMGWWIEGIRAETRDRSSILRMFQKKREVSILVSCKTLSEGIDLNGANCMLPWDPSNSVVENIQRIGRVLRLYKDTSGRFLKEQTPSTVLIPVFLDQDKYLACRGNRAKINTLLCEEIAAAERGNFRSIVNVCTALKSELADDDVELFNRLLAGEVTESAEKDSRKCSDKKTTVEKRISKRMKYNFTEDCGIILGLESIEGADDTGGMILTRLTTEVRAEDNWEKRCLEWIAMYEKLGRKPSRGSKNIAEILAGIWQSNQRTKYKKGTLLQKRTKILSETPGWTWKEEDTWSRQLDYWITMYKKLGKKPSQHSKNQDEKRAANWQHWQKQHYKNGKLSKERIKILSETPGWTWKKENIWNLQLEKWIAIYKKLSRKPSCNSKNSDEKSAGNWQQIQRQNYKKNKLSEERIKILNETPNWTWEEEDKWSLQLERWIAMYKKLGRKPSSGSKNLDEKLAGSWQNNQRTNYKKGTLSQEYIKILNETPNWTWEDDSWNLQLENWVAMYKKLDRKPSHGSRDPDEKKVGSWQNWQRQYYRNGKLSQERIKILNETSNWTWEEDDPWPIQYKKWIAIYHKLGKKPSTHSKDSDEKQTASWQNWQRQHYQQGKLSKERIEILNNTPNWTWSSTEMPNITIVKRKKPAQSNITIIKRKRPTPTLSPTKEEPTVIIRKRRSPLEEFHKRFKSMNAQTYAKTITPEEFNKYHEIANTYDKRDLPENRPIEKIAALLADSNKSSYSAIDLGCGTNQLRKHSAVSKMKWTSVDVHASDETVTIADMADLPTEEETYDIAVMCRSLWARNHKDVLKELFRILKRGGRAFICESFRRWFDIKTHTNTLIKDLKDIGFEIIYENGTAGTDTTTDVFQYIVIRKS